MYPHNITEFLPLHVAYLSLLISLFSMGLCIPRGSLQCFPSVVHKNLNAIDQLASFSFKATKELCIESTALYRFTSFTYVHAPENFSWLEYSTYLHSIGTIYCNQGSRKMKFIGSIHMQSSIILQPQIVCCIHIWVQRQGRIQIFEKGRAQPDLSSLLIQGQLVMAYVLSQFAKHANTIGVYRVCPMQEILKMTPSEIEYNGILSILSPFDVPLDTSTKLLKMYYLHAYPYACNYIATQLNIQLVLQKLQLLPRVIYNNYY